MRALTRIRQPVAWRRRASVLLLAALLFAALLLALAVPAVSLLTTWSAVADQSPPLARLSHQMSMRPNPLGPSSVIFPDQTLPLKFSHVQHLTLAEYADVDCVTCHDAAARSRSALDNLTPSEAACEPCHAIDRTQPDKQIPAGEPPVGCPACHIGITVDAQTGVRTVPRVYIPTPHIKFDHRAHVQGLNMTCESCHSDMVSARVGLATRAQMPRMKLCLGCHDGRKVAPLEAEGKIDATTGDAKTDQQKKPARVAEKKCTTCHIAQAGGFVKIEYPSGKLAPSGVIFGADHDMLFRVRHAYAAQNNADYCSSCHKKNFCIDCHDGVIKPMDFHGNDYVNMHAIDARRGTPDCRACHRQQTFCTGCHTRAGVSSDTRGGSEFAGTGPDTRFHPPGWVEDFGVRGENHHAFQAQRNIKQCAACHREQFCIGCHGNTVDTPGVNPHPADWAQSRRCRAQFARNQRMCLRCHLTADEARCL